MEGGVGWKYFKKLFWEGGVEWKHWKGYFGKIKFDENIQTNILFGDYQVKILKTIYFWRRELDENIQKGILEWVNFDENISKSYFGVGNQVPADMIVHFEGKQKLSVQLW